MTHYCVGKLTITGSDNGLSPRRHQAIIITSAGILLIRTLGTNFTDISIGNQTFSVTKMHLKMSSAKWRPISLGLNVLNVFSNITLSIVTCVCSAIISTCSILTILLTSIIVAYQVTTYYSKLPLRLRCGVYHAPLSEDNMYIYSLLIIFC